mmetsp:Transcript_4402/g.7879  ORF Transcript_4402/g.7879 Transcript_4402/m.7879 type:complete len:357 (-) Transcript_4402:115-1185(-)
MWLSPSSAAHHAGVKTHGQKRRRYPLMPANPRARLRPRMVYVERGRFVHNAIPEPANSDVKLCVKQSLCPMATNTSSTDFIKVWRREGDKTDENCQPLSAPSPGLSYHQCQAGHKRFKYSATSLGPSYHQASPPKRFKYPNPPTAMLQSHVGHGTKPKHPTITQVPKPPSNQPGFKSGFPPCPQISKRFCGSLPSESPRRFSNAITPDSRLSHEGSFTSPRASHLKFGLTVDSRGSRAVSNNMKINTRGIQGVSSPQNHTHTSRAGSMPNRFLASPLPLRQGQRTLAATPERTHKNDTAAYPSWHQRYQVTSRHGQRRHGTTRQPPVGKPCGDLHQYLKNEILGMRDQMKRESAIR